MRQNPYVIFLLKRSLLMCLLINICSGIHNNDGKCKEEIYNTFLKINCLTAFENNLSIPEGPTLKIADSTGKSYELKDLKNEVLSSTKSVALQNCTLRPGFFTSLNLTKLDSLVSFGVAHNTVLQNGSFKGADTLSKIALNNSNIEIIEPFAFSTLKNITILDLSCNKIEYLPIETFQNLKNLEVLDISNNSLHTLPEGIFDDLISLKCICLNSNAITSLPDSIFHQQSFLRTLDLQQNNLEALGQNTLSNITELVKLDISSNNLKNISSIFFSNNNLQRLDISKNKELVLHNHMFSGLHKLKKLSLSECNIAALPKGLFTNTSLLSRLYLSNNQIKVINPDTFINLPHLRILDLSYNNLTEINDGFFIYAQYVQVLKIDLECNQVTGIHVSSLNNKSSEFEKLNYKILFYLKGNPFKCDCNAYVIYSYLKNVISRYIEFLDSLACEYPENHRQKNLISLEPKDFICNITEDCPENCICIQRESDNTKITNCSNRNYEHLPTETPYNTSILDISHNNLTSLSDLNQTIWENLFEVHAEYNQIISTDLYLPRNVNILKLHHNNLKEIPDAIIKQSAFVKDIEITLANNSWQCDCSIRPFKEWLTSHISQVTDISDIYCSFPNNSVSTLSLMKLTDMDICSYVFLYDQYVIIPGITVLLVLTLIFFYRHKICILSYIYSHCNTCYMLFCCNRQIHEDKLYDCFVSYSSADREITMSILEHFETKPPYHKICIHERNWLPGRYIADNIVDSVQQSRKTLIIISEAFLKSEWFYLELKAAYYQSVQDKTDRLILIIKDLPSGLELKSYVRRIISSKPCIKWGETWFWEKLGYAIYQQNAFTGDEKDI